MLSQRSATNWWLKNCIVWLKMYFEMLFICLYFLLVKSNVWSRKIVFLRFPLIISAKLRHTHTHTYIQRQKVGVWAWTCNTDILSNGFVIWAADRPNDEAYYLYWNKKRTIDKNKVMQISYLVCITMKIYIEMEWKKQKITFNLVFTSLIIFKGCIYKM